jgi:hypothetical protein
LAIAEERNVQVSETGSGCWQVYAIEVSLDATGPVAVKFKLVSMALTFCWWGK